MGESLGQQHVYVKVRKSKLRPGILVEFERQERLRTYSVSDGFGADPGLVGERGDRDGVRGWDG